MEPKPHTVSKRSVLRTLEAMPEHFDADELIERIVLLQKIEEGVADAEAGRTLSLEEMRAHIEAKWRK